MSPFDRDHQPLVDWLRERGQSDVDIARILERLRDYDKLTNVDALMDAIATGDVDMTAIIKDVVG